MKPPNKAPTPNRRLGFPLTALASFVYLFCALPASPAAVGEAQCWAVSRGSLPGNESWRSVAKFSTIAGR